MCIKKCVEDDVAAVGCCVLGSLSTDPMQERTCVPSVTRSEYPVGHAHRPHRT